MFLGLFCLLRQKSWSIALSHEWQYVKLSDVSLGTRPRYSIVDEHVKKPTKQTKLIPPHIGLDLHFMFIWNFASIIIDGL